MRFFLVNVGQKLISSQFSVRCVFLLERSRHILRYLSEAGSLSRPDVMLPLNDDWRDSVILVN